MAQLLKIVAWNANGLGQHAQEIKIFLETHGVDILLISETHFTARSFIKFPHYNVYSTNHPDGTAHGGTAVIIRNRIKHHELPEYQENHIQATNISIELANLPVTISAVYSPPKHLITPAAYTHFFKTLGNRFIAIGDYNAKHVYWGSRLTRTDGRRLLSALQTNNLTWLSTGEPTYWPTDRRKKPDLIDFGIVKGLNIRQCTVSSCFELAADHSAITVTMNSHITQVPAQPALHNKRTDWEYFRQRLEYQLDLHVPLKDEYDIERAVTSLTELIQNVAWEATPKLPLTSQNNDTPIIIKDKIVEKRRLRQRWQLTRSDPDKREYNRANKQLKTLLSQHKNQGIQNYLENLSANEQTNYSLWKATRKIKRPTPHVAPIHQENGRWARSSKEKADAFAEYLTKVFTPFPCQLPDEEAKIKEFLESPFQMSLPLKPFTIREVEEEIQKINTKKSPGYDLITGTIIKQLPTKAIQALTHLYNSILRVRHFPSQWKTAQIIMILKPGKPPTEITSYRPISLLPILSKILEKLILNRLMPILDEQELLPKHQFGFRKQHGTVEQVHRITDKIYRDLEGKRYCSAVFLDVKQAFDRVWHQGLCYKLKQYLPYQMFELLRSYITNRHFLIKCQDETTTIHPISSGVPQGSALGPILYLIYTADLPTSRLTTSATYADDMAILASHINPQAASRYLQAHLNKIQWWASKWRIRVNESKSQHVTFTMKKENCPPVTLNGLQLPHSESVKYLGLHIDRRLTWRTHIFTKRKQLGLQLSKLYWLIGRKSKLSVENKLLIYKIILKPIWTYGISLWGTAATSNLAMLDRFQNKVLRIIVDAPWYVPNNVILSDLKIPTVKSEIKKYSSRYKDRLFAHPNDTVQHLMEDNNEPKRLKRYKPSDLPTRF